LSFNLSNSETLALYRFACGVAVGVGMDLEVGRQPLDAPTVARLRALS
jgi:hypothetical protein